jgi:predicted acyltransferase
MTPTPAAAPSNPTPSGQRILSVDVLRGFDMFWIIGGDAVAEAILEFLPSSVRAALLPQLRHSQWAGFTFHDLIFPLFLFVVGMSALFSVDKIVQRDGKAAAYRRIVRRAVLLFLLGVIFNGGFVHRWPNIRLMGVLQRIALCYLFTAIAVVHLRWRGLAIAFVTLLLGYWAWLSFVPLPGHDAISFAPGNNWTNYLDVLYLPGFKGAEKVSAQWEIVGLLSTLPAIATCLLGALAAHLLRSPEISERAKVGSLLGGGMASVAVGYAWGMQFPVILQLWTSSYVLVAGGFSCILLAFFHAVIDLWKFQRWVTPLLWIGSNAITLFMLHGIVGFNQLARRLANGDIRAAVGEPAGQLLLTAVSLGLILLLARFLYQRKIFLRV